MLAIRVAAISDSQSFLAAVQEALATDPGVDFVGSCMRERLRRFVQARKPDVLLVDGRIERPLSLCSRGERPRRPWIIVIAQEAKDLAEFGDLWKVAALAAGARGVLGRRSIAGQVVSAVRTVHGGGLFGPRAVVASVLDRRADPLPRDRRPQGPGAWGVAMLTAEALPAQE